MILKYHTDSSKILQHGESEVMGYMQDKIQRLINKGMYGSAQKVSDGMKRYVNQILARQHYRMDTYHEKRNSVLPVHLTAQAI